MRRAETPDERTVTCLVQWEKRSFGSKGDRDAGCVPEQAGGVTWLEGSPNSISGEGLVKAHTRSVEATRSGQWPLMNTAGCTSLKEKAPVSIRHLAASGPDRSGNSVGLDHRSCSR